MISKQDFLADMFGPPKGREKSFALSRSRWSLTTWAQGTISILPRSQGQSLAYTNHSRRKQNCASPSQQLWLHWLVRRMASDSQKSKPWRVAGLLTAQERDSVPGTPLTQLSTPTHREELTLAFTRGQRAHKANTSRAPGLE